MSTTSNEPVADSQRPDNQNPASSAPPVSPTPSVSSTPSVSPANTATQSDEQQLQPHDHIENEVQQLLSEMQSTFKSFSDNIFNRIQSMQTNIDDLHHTLSDMSQHEQPQRQPPVVVENGQQHIHPHPQ